MALMTLLTDFGLQDAYVGVMKGAIACISPTSQIIDLTHAIPPQDVAAARFVLMTAVPYFPMGTVHVAVVDPGVGSTRRAIALQFAQGYLVGPDNGIFGGVLQQYPAIAAVELTNSNYWHVPNPSHTFHGRDVFAPVAAHLANGVLLERLGQPIDPASLVTLEFPNWEQEGDRIIGCIQYVDHFGNAVTNIPESAIALQDWWVEIAGHLLRGRTTYAEVAVGEPVALIGSHNFVEIAVNGGSAKARLQLQVGDRVVIS
ncbi:SAM hydrolase/SAM-dependent halogenase family protein [Leptolyngbya sp. AN02str]|uniref:SAM hydrolase/SAM-dependent halogenase family protein n=1 Tax=Leptolyngbya sp. AN02str TaxID=3423363 RepID=UPI003D314D0F